jgi:hypothetical protein
MQNIFLEPSKGFEQKIKNPNLIVSLLIVIIVSIFSGALLFIASQNPILGIFVSIMSFIEWFVFCLVYLIMSFLVKNKKTISETKSFVHIASASSQIWFILIIVEIFMLMALLGNIFTAIAGIIIFVLLIFVLINSFVLMKTLLDSNFPKTFVAWILALIIYSLSLTLVSAIIQNIILILI